MAQSIQSEILTKKEYRIRSEDGTEISVWRIAAGNNKSTCSPAVIHAHGGAFIMRNLAMELVDLEIFRLKPLGRDWLLHSGVVLLYVSYRLATEKPFPAPSDDVFSAFKWATDESTAADLGVNRHKVGVMGFSAGGNLALTAALRARDEHVAPPVCALMLIYPMLDPDTEWEKHRGIPNNNAKETLRKGWDMLLQGLESLPEEQQKYARLLSLDCTGLPPTYVDVGTNDYFLEEDLQLMSNLTNAGVDLVKAEWEDMPHGFESMGNENKIYRETIREARQLRWDFWRRIFQE